MSPFIGWCALVTFVWGSIAGFVHASPSETIPREVALAKHSVFKVVPLLYPPIEVPLKEAKSVLDNHQVSTLDPKSQSDDILLELLRQSYWQAKNQNHDTILLQAETSGTAFTLQKGKRLLSAGHTFRPGIKYVGRSFYTPLTGGEPQFKPGRFMGRPMIRDPKENQEIIKKLHQIPAHFLLFNSKGIRVFDSRKSSNQCRYRQIGITDAFDFPTIPYQGKEKKLPWFMTHYAQDYVVIDCEKAISRSYLRVRDMNAPPIQGGEQLYSIGHMDTQVEISPINYEEHHDWVSYEKRDARTTHQSAWIEKGAVNHILFLGHGKIKPGFSGGPTVTSQGEVYGLTNHADLIPGQETSLGVTLQYIESVLKRY